VAINLRDLEEVVAMRHIDLDADSAEIDIREPLAALMAMDKENFDDHGYDVLLTDAHNNIHKYLAQAVDALCLTDKALTYGHSCMLLGDVIVKAWIRAHEDRATKEAGGYIADLKARERDAA